MIVKWYGQTSFLLQDSTGRRILINPFDIENYEALISLNPSIIALTRMTTNINKTMYSFENCTLIQDIGTFNLDFVLINGYKSFHDNFRGAKRGVNTVFTFLLDNTKICHLGHLGHMLTDDYINKLGKIDLLMIPVGGHFALDGKIASKLCKKINPKFVIPMYYKTNNSLKFLDDCNEFIISMKNATKIPTNFIDTTNLVNNNSNTKVLLFTENKPM